MGKSPLCIEDSVFWTPIYILVKEMIEHIEAGVLGAKFWYVHKSNLEFGLVRSIHAHG